MATIKLSEWCTKAGVSYLTAYRWFKSGKLPVAAYQTESGTILVEDEQPMNNNTQNDIMSLFLKKTVEFSKNNASIEDFAAYVLSNFSLKQSNLGDTPKYSKNKPKSEDIQKHFQQFIPKVKKPKLSVVLNNSEEPEDFLIYKDNDDLTVLLKDDKAEIVNTASFGTVATSLSEIKPEIKSLVNDLAAAFNSTSSASINNTYHRPYEYADEGSATNFVGGTITRNVDLTTPQLNYQSTNNTSNKTFTLTEKEVNASQDMRGKLAELATDIRSIAKQPKKRGRKPSKK